MSPLVKTEVMVGENTGRLLAETTVTLATPAVKIRSIAADVTNLVANVIEDNVILEGIIRQHVFYVGTDTVVHHQAEDLPFCTYVVITGAQPGMNVEVFPTVEQVLPDLAADGNTVTLKAVLEMLVKVGDTRQLNLQEGGGVTYLFHQVRGENTVQEVSQSTVALAAPALKITDATAQVVVTDSHVIEDKVVVEGRVRSQICYVSLDDNLEHHQADDIVFSTLVDVPGVAPGMTGKVNSRVEDVLYELSPDGTALAFQVAFELFVKVTEDVELALAPGTTLIKAEQVVGEDNLHTLIESTCVLAPTAQRIKQVTAEVDSVAADVIPGKVIVQGILRQRIYFTGVDDINYEREEEVPFMGYVAIGEAVPGMAALVTPKVNGILQELSSSGDSLRQKVMLELHVRVLQTVQAAVAEAAEL